MRKDSALLPAQDVCPGFKLNGISENQLTSRFLNKMSSQRKFSFHVGRCTLSFSRRGWPYTQPCRIPAKPPAEAEASFQHSTVRPRIEECETGAIWLRIITIFGICIINVHPTSFTVSHQKPPPLRDLLVGKRVQLQIRELQEVTDCQATWPRLRLTWKLWALILHGMRGLRGHWSLDALRT